MTKAEVVATIVPHLDAAPGASGEAFAPANVALIKYWGKRDDLLNLPVTDSLSVSLGRLGTTTRVTTADVDDFTLNDRHMPADDPFSLRLTSFLDHFRPAQVGFRVTTTNTVPTAAGFASSASAFAALVKALDNLYGWQLEKRQLSILARLGSGSACRSVYDGFVHWHAGTSTDGSDSYAQQLDTTWPGLRIGVIAISKEQKSIGSRPAMRATRKESILYRSWPDKVRQDLSSLKTALATFDLPMLGQVAESNALSMHATMLGAWPPILYWQPATVATLQRIWRLRSEGLQIYATMDAGPNIKLLFDAQQTDIVSGHFPEMTVVAPFANA